MPTSRKRIARWTSALMLCSWIGLSSGRADGQSAAPQGNAPQPTSAAQQGQNAQRNKSPGRSGQGTPGSAASSNGQPITGGNSTPKQNSAAVPTSGTPADSGVQRSIIGTSSGGPAPVSTQKVYVEGQGAAGLRATDDKPLLPIAQLKDSLGIRSGTPIRVRLKQSIDSGRARNGDLLEAVLAEPVGGQPAGAPVQVTVVLSLRAGVVASNGELSLQVISIANHRVLSDIITAQGKEGPKELPDAAPSLGTDAGFSADQVITLNAS